MKKSAALVTVVVLVGVMTDCASVMSTREVQGALLSVHLFLLVASIDAVYGLSV